MSNEETSSRSTDSDTDHSESSRRQVLQAVGSSAVLGVGLSQASGSVAARDDDSYETERLSEKEAGELRGEVMSSSAFKTVRQELQDRDFWPGLGEKVISARVILEASDEEYEVFKTVCDYTGEADNKEHNAVLYAKKQNGTLVVRSVCHHEGNSVMIHESDCKVGDNSGADETLTQHKIPVVGGGA
ncbi:hypothetical protein [Halosimplex halobium]|uniref:hypothetical protein n=1 Tax=Halosimplex halobium TaxID=3396618 RepID=UPI003F550AFB